MEALTVAQFIETADVDQFVDLADCGNALIAAYRTGDIPQILVAKRIFYDAICAGAGNLLAFAIINRLVLRTSSLRRRSMMRPERQAESILEIAALLDAIERRDIVRARAAAEGHVAAAARSALG